MLRAFQPESHFNDLDDWNYAAIAPSLGDGERVTTGASSRTRWSTRSRGAGNFRWWRSCCRAARPRERSRASYRGSRRCGRRRCNELPYSAVTAIGPSISPVAVAFCGRSMGQAGPALSRLGSYRSPGEHCRSIYHNLTDKCPKWEDAAVLA
jgi:hypothetical protein